VDHKELLRKVKRYAKDQGLEFHWEALRGKGGHGTVHLGKRFSVVPTGKGELKTGTQRAILKQLGLKEEDVR
jgi:mRNA interferase HicA